jgi:XTP/dITP diphosphohydrolase
MKIVPEKVYFASSNSYKYSEYQRIFDSHGLSLALGQCDIDEIQALEPEKIMADKIVKAYASLRRPVIVDHSSIEMDALGGLPQGLSKPFWMVLQGKICTIAGSLGTKATMTICLGFCDGLNVVTKRATVEGTIASAPGTGPFHLDRVFRPHGAAKVFSDMTLPERDGFSPRSLAVAELLKESLVKNFFGIP